LAPYDTTDELYYRQQGDEPIHVLATARSSDTGRDEPMAFVYEYGKGRVFQTVLGHDVASIPNAGTAALIRRGSTWAADRPQLASTLRRQAPIEATGPAPLGDAIVPQAQ